MNKKNFGMCVYCGENRKLTRDHIPPANLFPKPRPDNLITVPSCLVCNAEASKDDEYFRLNLVIREDLPILAKRPFQTTMRGLGRSDRSGLKNDLQSRTYLAEKYSTGGIYLGIVTKYDVDARRMDEVAKRIVKGLYYHELGKRLSDKYFVSAFSPSGQVATPQNLQVTIDWLKNQPRKLVGTGDVFSYHCFTNVKDDVSVSMWLLIFYQKTYFLGFTIPN